MGIWDCEIVKANGDLYAFVRIQNDFTGNISGAFRTQEATLDFIEHALDGGVTEIHITQHTFTKKEE